MYGLITGNRRISKAPVSACGGKPIDGMEPYHMSKRGLGIHDRFPPPITSRPQSLPVPIAVTRFQSRLEVKVHTSLDSLASLASLAINAFDIYVLAANYAV